LLGQRLALEREFLLLREELRAGFDPLTVRHHCVLLHDATSFSTDGRDPSPDSMATRDQRSTDLFTITVE
jgi:hypothetical protein